MIIALVWLLLGYLYCIALVVGQAVLLMLSERASRKQRVLRSVAYWACVAALVGSASLQPTLARVFVLPLVLALVSPYYALRDWLG